MLTAQRRVRITERRGSMNNEQKKEYVKPEISIIEMGYDASLLQGSIDCSVDNCIDFEDD